MVFFTIVLLVIRRLFRTSIKILYNIQSFYTLPTALSYADTVILFE